VILNGAVGPCRRAVVERHVIELRAAGAHGELPGLSGIV
jgi:hypothetical protein